MGSVSILTTGLRKVFTMARTTATTTAVTKLSTVTLGRRYAVIATARAFMRSLTNSFIYSHGSTLSISRQPTLFFSPASP